MPVDLTSVNRRARTQVSPVSYLSQLFSGLRNKKRDHAVVGRILLERCVEVLHSRPNDFRALEPCPLGVMFL